MLFEKAHKEAKLGMKRHFQRMKERFHNQDKPIVYLTKTEIRHINELANRIENAVNSSDEVKTYTAEIKFIIKDSKIRSNQGKKNRY